MFSTSFPPANPLRILCCIHATDLGGVERVALRLCRAWAAAGAEVHVALGRRDGPPPGVTPAQLSPAPRLPISTAPFETLWMIAWLAREIRRLRPDVLFCPGNSYTIVAVCMRLLFGRRCPPIVAKLSNDLARPDLPAVVRPLYRAWCRIQGAAIDRFVALSAEMAAQDAPLLGIARNRIIALANPVLDDAAPARLARAGEAARGSRGRGRRFVAAGRLVPQKNHMLLLEAFADGASSDDSLAIFGEGPLRGRLERAIARLGLVGRVTLAGARAAPEQWLDACDHFLLSSDFEGVPAVIVEALAAGIPVIATDCCASMAPLLGDARVGTLVPRGDATAFARAIQGATLARFHVPAMYEAASRFTSARSAPAFLQVLRSAAKRQGDAVSLRFSKSESCR